jgi:hypothetical protein
MRHHEKNIEPFPTKQEVAREIAEYEELAIAYRTRALIQHILAIS